jgi:hypothetical protein
LSEKITVSPIIDARDKNHETRDRDATTSSSVTTKAGDRVDAGDSNSLKEYLYGKSTFSNGSRNQAWSDTMQGRVAMRMFSRGIMGAAGFALGGRYAHRQLLGYEPHIVDKTKPLQVLAKGFDTVIGEPIKFIVKAIAPEHKANAWVNSATRFRSKVYYPPANPAIPNTMIGRSLGAEMVSVSFDFSCMSFGDAITRNIIQGIDPNIQKPWVVDGKFDPKKWAESAARATWRSITKNAGEDWGVALPYVYYMKWQRQGLARHFPGSKLMIDHSWNGGSLKLDSMTGKVIGDYQLPGAIDLHGRFTTYNWFTLMYREAYDAIGKSLADWKKDGYKVQLSMPQNPLAEIAGGVGQTVRYTLKSFIKSNLYMHPAVPFFWAFRTPQTKWRASPICEEHISGDAILSKGPEGKLSQRVNQAGVNTHLLPTGERGFFGPHQVTESHDLNPFALKNQKTLFSAILNPLGIASYKTGNLLQRSLEPFASSNKTLIGMLGKDAREREMTMRSFVDAGFAYTPYFAAKAEFGMMVDDRPPGGGLGNMDKAIYGLLDHAVKFDLKGMGANVKRIGELYADGSHVSHAMREGDDKKTQVVGDGSIIPRLPADPATRVEKSTIVGHHKQALSGNSKDQKDWKEYIADKREVAQLHPSHPTVQ